MWYILKGVLKACVQTNSRMGAGIAPALTVYVARDYERIHLVRVSGDTMETRVTIGLSKRAGLRAGYDAVMVVLGLSAIEAYRIQISVSEQHLDIYRRYAAEEAELSTLRRNLWLAGNNIRDFFIHSPVGASKVNDPIAREVTA
jgi:hypothetical protein